MVRSYLHLKSGPELLVIVFILSLIRCSSPELLLPVPNDYGSRFTAFENQEWLALLTHWEKQKGMLRPADLLLVRHMLTNSASNQMHLSWHSISQNKWGVLLVFPITPGSEDFVSEYQQPINNEKFRSFTFQAYQLEGSTPFWAMQRRGYWVVTPHRSLLQDAASTIGIPELPHDRQALIREAWTEAYGVQSAYLDASGLRLQMQESRFGSPSTPSLSQFPGFLSSGVMLTQNNQQSHDDHVQPNWALQGILNAGKKKETFLFWSDPIQRMDAFWTQLVNTQGLLQDFTYQGIEIRQVLTEDWSYLLEDLGWGSLRSPFLAYVEGGWVMANSRSGMERWIDYWMSGETMISRLPLMEIKEADIFFWYDKNDLLSQKIYAWLGPFFPKGNTLIGLEQNQQWVTLEGVDKPAGYALKRWQAENFSWPIQACEVLDDTIVIHDQRTLSLLNGDGGIFYRETIPQEEWVGGAATGGYFVLITNAHCRIVSKTGEKLSMTALSGDLGPVISWSYRLDSDQQLWVFILGASGKIQVVRHLSPYVGYWTSAAQHPLGITTLRSKEMDVVVVFGESLWEGYSLLGHKLWEREPPGIYVNHASGSAAAVSWVEVDSLQLGALSIRGYWQPILEKGKMNTEEGQDIFVIQSDDKAIMWRMPPLSSEPEIIGQFESRNIWVDYYHSTQHTYSIKQQQYDWLISAVDSDNMFEQSFPGRLPPVLFSKEDQTVALTIQEDKLVAYVLP